MGNSEVEQKEKMTKPLKIPTKDLAFIYEQKPSVIKFWMQCWDSDPYGSSWQTLNYNLPKSSFFHAKKILWDEGLFAFKRETSTSDNRKTECWKVLNLHGSRSGRKKAQWFKSLYSSDTSS